MNIFSRLRVEKNYICRNKKESILSLKETVKCNDRLCVLSNGPSLNQSIRENKEDLLNTDLICLNSFPKSDFFVELKPRYYTLFDPLYFGELSQVYNNGEKVKNLSEEIKNKVSWDFTVIAPQYTKKTPFIHEISKNSDVHVKYCSDFCVDFLIDNEKKEKKLYELLRQDKVSFPSQTVSCAAIAFGIFMGYREIDVIGLDMSMFKNHHIDQKTNQGYLTADHFYNDSSNERSGGGDYSLDSVNNYKAYASLAWYLKAYSIMFYQMEFIDRYAKYYGITIKNKSAFSYVDAFERG